MNHSIVNKHGGILNWRYKVPAKWNELHLKLWFRDNGLAYPKCHEAIVNVARVEDVGVWWCLSGDIDFLDAIAAKARLSGAYAFVSVSKLSSMVMVDMRPAFEVQP